MSHPPNLAQLVQKHFPQARLLRAWPLQGGISAEMTALEIAGADGKSTRWIVRRPGEAALKRNPRAAQDEFALLQILHSQGLAAPAPWALDQSGEIFAGPFIVMAYIEGQPDFAPAHPDDFAMQLAGQLARIHALEGARADLSFLPGQAQEFSLRRSLAQADAALEVGRIRAALASFGPSLPHNAPALLHGDYWPGNILWQKGRLAAVIDWEDAALGDPLSDLAISRLDLLWIYGRETMQAFTRYYLSAAAIDPRGLPFWDLCAALRLARLAGADLGGWAAFFQPYGREDITEHTIRAHYDAFVSQALAKLEEKNISG